MRDFLTAFGARLDTLSADERPAARTHRRGLRSTTTWRAPLGGLATGTAIVAALLATTAGAPTGLRILEAPTADASALADRFDADQRTALDLGEARRFATPDGPGLVIPARDGQSICLAVPDRALRGQFGVNCLRLADVQRDGLPGQIMKRAQLSLSAFVLPAGADRVTLTGPRGERLPFIHDEGVVSATLRTSATLRYRAHGRTRETAFVAPLSDHPQAAIDCGNGRMVQVPPPGTGDPGHGPPGGPHGRRHNGPPRFDRSAICGKGEATPRRSPVATPPA